MNPPRTKVNPPRVAGILPSDLSLSFSLLPLQPSPQCLQHRLSLGGGTPPLDEQGVLCGQGLLGAGTLDRGLHGPPNGLGAGLSGASAVLSATCPQGPLLHGVFSQGALALPTANPPLAAAPLRSQQRLPVGGAPVQGLLPMAAPGGGAYPGGGQGAYPGGGGKPIPTLRSTGAGVIGGPPSSGAESLSALRPRAAAPLLGGSGGALPLPSLEMQGVLPFPGQGVINTPPLQTPPLQTPPQQTPPQQTQAQALLAVTAKPVAGPPQGAMDAQIVGAAGSGATGAGAQIKCEGAAVKSEQHATADDAAN